MRGFEFRIGPPCERDFVRFSKRLAARSACAASGRALAHHQRRHSLFPYKEEQEEQEKKECKKSLYYGKKCRFRFPRSKRADAAQAARCPHKNRRPRSHSDDDAPRGRDITPGTGGP